MSDNWYEFLKPFCDDALANALQNDMDPDVFLQSVREVCHQRIAALSALKPFEVPNDAASHGNLDKNHSNVANNRPVKTVGCHEHFIVKPFHNYFVINSRNQI